MFAALMVYVRERGKRGGADGDACLGGGKDGLSSGILGETEGRPYRAKVGVQNEKSEKRRNTIRKGGERFL